MADNDEKKQPDATIGGLFVKPDGSTIGAIVVEGNCRSYMENCDEDPNAAHLVIAADDCTSWCRMTGIMISQVIYKLNRSIDELKESFMEKKISKKQLKEEVEAIKDRIEDIFKFCVLFPQVFTVGETFNAKKSIVMASNNASFGADVTADLIQAEHPEMRGLLSGITPEQLERLTKEVEQGAVILHIPKDFKETYDWMNEVSQVHQKVMGTILTHRMSTASEEVLKDVPDSFKKQFGH